MIIEFLKGFIEVLKGYFKEVEEESIKDNFVIIYELLDECIDNGFIQCLDTNLLKEYIKTSYHELIKPSKNKPAINGVKVFSFRLKSFFWNFSMVSESVSDL